MRSSYTLLTERTVQFCACALALLLLTAAGCESPNEEIRRITENAQRIPLGGDHDAVRFFLGFPTKISPDHRVWWYLRPEPEGIQPKTGGLSVLIRFDDHKKTIEREWIAWTRIGRNRFRLQTERLVADPQTTGEADFADVLGEKLSELARTANRYEFHRQQASDRLTFEGVLLLSIDRWTGPGSRLHTVRGEIDADAHPQVAEAVPLAWQIRRFAIALDFDSTVPATRASR